MAPRPGPRMVFVGEKLPKELDALLKRLAKAEGVSKSELIRRLIEEALHARGQSPTI